MDMQKRLEELTQQQAVLIQQYQEAGTNIQRLAGAIAFAREMLDLGAEDKPAAEAIDTAAVEVSPNGAVADEEVAKAWQA
jgi:hypothetical protein